MREARHSASARRTFNVYCDESCHLEHDGHLVMVLGAAWCALEKSREIAVSVREIKRKHGMKTGFEAKWTKVSPAKKELYLELIDYFFDNDNLSFRAVVIPDKSKLRHKDYGQDHDTWYYKMFFRLLDVLFKPNNSYRVYMDRKDTRSAGKTAELHKILADSRHDYSRKLIERVQDVRSDEVETMQLADLLIGAISYANRGQSGNEGKEALVECVRRRSGCSLTGSTPFSERKFNILVWRALETNGA